MTGAPRDFLKLIPCFGVNLHNGARCAHPPEGIKPGATGKRKVSVVQRALTAPQKQNIPILVMKALLLVGLLLVLSSTGHGFTLIAHRGASGWLPEHTAAAYAYAHARGADFIEQDVVLTRDGVPIVLHDIHLETTTNVRAIFPDRHRENGRYYAIDFTLAEIRQLRKGERIKPRSGKAVFPGRFPAGKFLFPILTLQEAADLIAGLNKATGRTAGIYPEIKKPAFHHKEGQDPVAPVMRVLGESGWLDNPERVYIQCFDPAPLREIHATWGPQLQLIQLIGKNRWKEADVDYRKLRSVEGLQEIAAYADGIGLPLDDLIAFTAKDPRWKAVKAHAHAAGLRIHPFTLREETLPKAMSYGEMMRFLRGPEGVDGVFTDFP
jgi:glycerophosphoryl diester phosphodiesterase